MPILQRCRPHVLWHWPNNNVRPGSSAVCRLLSTTGSHHSAGCLPAGMEYDILLGLAMPGHGETRAAIGALMPFYGNRFGQVSLALRDGDGAPGAAKPDQIGRAHV